MSQTEPIALYLNGISVENRLLSDLKLTEAWKNGVFETMHWTGDAVPLWKFHRERLERGVARLGLLLPEPVDPAEVVRGRFTGQSCRIRLSVIPWTAVVSTHLPFDVGRDDRKNEAAGLIVLSVHALPEAQRDVRLVSASAPHPFRDAVHSSIKSNSREYYDDCFKSARDQGFDDMLLHDPAGNVSETCIANVLVAREGKLWTPDVCTNPLQGVGLRWLTIHSSKETNPKPALFKPEVLPAAGGLWIVNALRGVVPVHSILLQGKEHPINQNPWLTRKLQAIFPF